LVVETANEADATMEIVTPGAANLGLFVSAALVLLLVPGPAVLYLVARSVEQGRVAGLVSILGIHAATLVHVAAAALGLSAILASSALAFSVVKYAGAAYLIWLGLRKIFGRAEALDLNVTANGRGRARLFRDGFIVNLFNPKTALFFLAFLPQFVEVDRGHVAMQIAVLGLLFTVLGFFTDSCYALAAGTAGNWLKRSRGYLKFERYVSGVLFIGLGLTAAFAGNQRK
jgi:threonine/homoserine/homoserine lactone efflux protein